MPGNFFAFWVWIDIQQRFGAKQHARRAKTALYRSFGDKRLLQRMQLVIVAQSLNRHNVVAIRFYRQHQAGIHIFPVDQNGTGATVSFAAPDFGSCESQPFPQQIDKQQLRLDFQFNRLSI